MNFKAFRNNQTVKLSEIPDLKVNEFYDNAVNEAKNGMRPSLMFGSRENSGVRIYLIMSDDANSMLHLSSLFLETDSLSYPSLTIEYPFFNLFEREIFEEFGIVPEGHPFLKGVRYPQNRFDKNALMSKHPFFEIDDQDVHQVAVGPVHS